MIAFIVMFLLSVGHTSGESVALRTSVTSVTSSSESNVRYSIPSYTTLSGHSPVAVYLRPPETAFQSQDTPHGAGRNQSQLANRNQVQKVPRLFLSRLIIASMSQYPRNIDNASTNAKTPTISKKNDDKIVFKDEDLNKVETNTVVPLNDSSVTFPDHNVAEVSTVKAKTNVNTTNTKSKTVNVSLEDRSSFEGDKCPTGYAKVNGKCVPIED